MFPSKLHQRQFMDERMKVALLSAYGRKRLAAPVPQSVVVKESSGRGGRTLMEYAPDSPAAKAYQHLAERVYHDR